MTIPEGTMSLHGNDLTVAFSNRQDAEMAYEAIEKTMTQQNQSPVVTDERLAKEWEDYLASLSKALGGVSRYINDQGDYRPLEDWKAFLLDRVESLRLYEGDQRRRAEAAEARVAELEKALEPFVAFFDKAMEGFTPGYAERQPPKKTVLGWNHGALMMHHFTDARAALHPEREG